MSGAYMWRFRLGTFCCFSLSLLAASQLSSDLSQCCQACFSGMIARDQSLDCAPTDAACLCNAESCPTGKDVSSCINHVLSYRAAATSGATLGGSGSGSIQTGVKTETSPASLPRPAPTGTQPYTTILYGTSSITLYTYSEPGDTSSAWTTILDPNGFWTLYTHGEVATTMTSSGAQTSHTSTTASASPDSSLSLSTGAKIGIGVGVSLGVLLILFVAGFILVKRRKARHRGAREVAEQTRFEKAELQNAELPHVHGRAELASPMPVSAQAAAIPAERQEVAELSSSLAPDPRQSVVRRRSM